MSNTKLKPANVEPKQLAYKRCQMALAYAKQKMLAEGLTYPIYDQTKTAEENHQLLMNYAAIESQYVIEFMKNPNPRPIETFPARENWVTKIYD